MKAKTGLDTIRVGAVQMDVVLGAVKRNLAAAVEAIKGLADDGVRLVLLPEMFSCGFDNNNLVSHAQKTPEVLERLMRLASENRQVLAGSLPEKADGGVYNTLYVIDMDRGVVGFYRKTHLFSLTGEPEFFLAGDKAVVCDTSAGRLGLTICFDLRFPELCRTLALRGATMVLVPAQWPSGRIEQWDVLLRARAIENQLFVLACNRCGKDPDLAFGGHSALIDPMGKVLAKGPDGRRAPCTVSGNPDWKTMRDFRQRIPCLQERMPQVYEL